jgi:16S rRNA G527 N7-methylase RsmG
MNPELFARIKKEYDGFYRDLLRNGKLPFGSTKNGFWGSVVSDEVYDAFKKLRLHKHKSFVDLGSGDGKTVLIASLFCKRAVGIELDNELFNKSKEMQEKLNISNALFYNNDFNEHSVTGYDVVFLYPDGPMHRGIEKKLLNELTGKLVHYGHHFHPNHLEKESSINVNGTLVSVYVNK